METDLVLTSEQYENIVSLINDGNMLLAQLNTIMLFIVGSCAGFGVCYVLYKFLRKFF